MHPSSAAGQELAELLPAGFPTRPAARSRPLSTRPARPAAGPVRPAAGPVRPATSAAAQPLGRPAPRTPAVHQPQGPACGGSRSHGPRKPVDHSRNIKATRRGPEWLPRRTLLSSAVEFCGVLATCSHRYNRSEAVSNVGLTELVVTDRAGTKSQLIGANSSPPAESLPSQREGARLGVDRQVAFERVNARGPLMAIENGDVGDDRVVMSTVRLKLRPSGLNALGQVYEWFGWFWSQVGAPRKIPDARETVLYRLDGGQDLGEPVLVRYLKSTDRKEWVKHRKM